MDTEYWNKFYRSNAEPVPPSQFAAFVANEFGNAYQILELGSGNGRDSFFFASMGYQVIGVDNSIEAISGCKNRIMSKHENVQFLHMDMIEAIDKIDELGLHKDEPIVIYARFIYHALSESQSIALLSKLGKATKIFDLKIALEFRNEDDSKLYKYYSNHFRRYESTERFREKCKQHDLQIVYEASGIGFAKHKFDDASVTRAILI